jgi:Carboxypeptidase regulatory-like domain
MSWVRSRRFDAVLRVGSLGFALCTLAASQTPAGDVPEGPYRIAGTVVNKSGGAALPLSRVTIRNTKNPKDVQSQLTGDDGRFEFRVPTGKYGLHAAKRGFLSSDYNQHDQFSSAIVTGAGIDTETLQLQLAPSAVLSGKILDEFGDPIRQAIVTLWREDHTTGLSRIMRYREDVSDDQGAYEFSPLDVGTYFLSVSATPWYAVHPATAVPEGAPAAPAVVDRGLDVVYPTTYYAGATESEDATPIPVRGGDRLEVVLHPTPVPALHIVIRSEPDANKGYSFPLLQKRIFDGFERQQNSGNVQGISNGVFEMTTAPGKYTLLLASPTQSGRLSDVDITQDHQEVDASSGEATSKITATLRVLGEDAAPRDVSAILRDNKQRVDYGQPTGNGEMQFLNVAPGSYEVVVGSQMNSYGVVKVVSEGQETSGHTLKVPAGASLSVTLTLASGSGRVEGFAKQLGKGIAGAMVVLIPKHPEENRELFRRDQSDMDGSFLLQGVIPGTYTVIAIADGWDLDWSRAGVLAKYVGHGQTLVVPASGSHAVQLPEAVEVQGK